MRHVMATKLQKCMQQAEVDAILLFTSPWAVSGYWQIFGTNAAEAGLVMKSGKMVVITWSILEEVAKKDSWADDFVGYYPYQISIRAEEKVETLFQVLKQVLDENGLLGSKIGIEESSMASSQLVSLKSSITEVAFKDVTVQLNEALATKAPEELRLIEKVVRIADIGAEAGVRAVKAGVTELQVVGKINEALSSAGSYQVWFPVVALSGPNSQFLGKYPTTRKIRKGDLVLMDLGPVYKGYNADISRTTAIGRPSLKKRKMLEATIEALDSAIEAIKPGVKAGEVDHIAREAFKRYGFDGCFIHHLGHPVFGPWGPMLIPGSETVLREGMTFTLEPGVYIPGQGGVRIEHNVIVTSKGARKLDRAERRLWRER
jgi:Xaa-Pro dipeptidase